MSKSILITGCSSGFGRLTAESAAQHGMRVFATMRDPTGRNRKAADYLRSAAEGGALDLEVLPMDITDDDSVNAAVGAALERAGSIDVLVNNAGVFSRGYLEAFTVDELQANFSVNVFGAMRVTRALLPSMREHGEGLVVTVSSVAGRAVFPFSVPYCAAKFALEAFAEGYRYELARFGVDSVIVEPTAYPTAVFDRAQVPADTERTAAYADLDSTFASVFTGLHEAVSGPEAPDPVDVADAILHLADLPRGQRPLRTVVSGADGPWKQLNATQAAFQADVLENNGLAELKGGPGA